MKVVLALPMLLFCFETAIAQIKAEKIWSMSQGFDGPESSHFDPVSNAIYVSNVSGSPTAKDQKGWISKVSVDGKMIQQKWISGLHAPKGIRVAKGLLWVTDIDRVLAFDVRTAKKTREIHVPDAKFLNDPAVAPDGTVYVSDMMNHTIYTIGKGQKAQVFVRGKEFQSPNGLLVQPPYLRVAAWGDGIKDDFSTTNDGALYNVNLKTKKKSPIQDQVGHLDGLEALGKNLGGGFVVSDWSAGKVFWIAKSKRQVLLQGLKGSADLGWIPGRSMLIVPEMQANKVAAFKLSKGEKRLN